MNKRITEFIDKESLLTSICGIRDLLPVIKERIDIAEYEFLDHGFLVQAKIHLHYKGAQGHSSDLLYVVYDERCSGRQFSSIVKLLDYTLSPVNDFQTFKEAIDYCDKLTYD